MVVSTGFRNRTTELGVDSPRASEIDAHTRSKLIGTTAHGQKEDGEVCGIRTHADRSTSVGR